jgi:hypothetical protein
MSRPLKEGVMGHLGLWAIGIVIWASERLPPQKRTLNDYWLALTAHLALGCVTIVGRIIDGVAPPRAGDIRARRTSTVIAFGKTLVSRR